jgi:hypothetical protein
MSELDRLEQQLHGQLPYENALALVAAEPGVDDDETTRPLRHHGITKRRRWELYDRADAARIAQP